MTMLQNTPCHIEWAAAQIPDLRSRAGTREIPLGNSREFPEIFYSRWFPGIFSISREISGNFYVLWVKSSSVSLNF